MNPLISIVVPVYNVELYLDECLDSIVEQTYQNIEIIIVDDGSSDNSSTLCDQWALKDARIRVIHQPNSGLSEARNRGIEIASGQYIYFVDSDDRIDKFLCQRIIDIFQKDCADIVVFGLSRITASNETISSEPGKEMCLNKEGALKALYSGEIKDYAWNKVYKRAVWKDVRFPTGRAYEDIGTMYKVFLNADTICCIPDVLYFYRKRAGSIIATMSTNTLRDLFQMRKQSYTEMMTIYPRIAHLRFESVALCAKACLDRALWDNFDPKSLDEAISFLKQNKEEVQKMKNWELQLYCYSPGIYRLFRLQKRRAGNIIRKVRKRITQ